MTTPSDKVAIYISRDARDYYASYVPSSLVPPMASEVWAACAESKASEQIYDVTIKGLTLEQLRENASLPYEITIFPAQMQWVTLACRAKLVEIEGRKP